MRAIFEQGVRCLPVILIVGLFTGLVLGLQGYHVLNRFGSESLLGTLVSLSIVRELGPVLAALMLVGQAGSALAAELGIQRNTEQIVALDTMGVNSVETRFLATAVAGARPALVDLSGVELVTSMGLRMLISTARGMSQRHTRLVLFGAQDLVQEVLETAAIDTLMAVVATEAEAMALLKH